MNIRAFLLALLWFSAFVYAGYRLTERSFAWIDGPIPETPPLVTTRVETFVIDLQDLSDRSPEELREMAKDLSPQQLLCLRASIAPDRVSAVMAGDITSEEATAAQKCLE